MFKINNLTYQYDKTRKALDNVSMDFNKGNIIGIIGSNVQENQLYLII